jgi:hypothetical protein
LGSGESELETAGSGINGLCFAGLSLLASSAVRNDRWDFDDLPQSPSVRMLPNSGMPSCLLSAASPCWAATPLYFSSYPSSAASDWRLR